MHSAEKLFAHLLGQLNKLHMTTVVEKSPEITLPAITGVLSNAVENYLVDIPDDERDDLARRFEYVLNQAENLPPSVKKSLQVMLRN